METKRRIRVSKRYPKNYIDGVPGLIPPAASLKEAPVVEEVEESGSVITRVAKKVAKKKTAKKAR